MDNSLLHLLPPGNVSLVASVNLFPIEQCMPLFGTLLLIPRAPNSGNGYPFPGDLYSANNSSNEFALLDTNKDGNYTILDDPYSPFYPGDEFVDWVGFSAYYYGAVYPWEANVVSPPGVIEAMMTGVRGMGNYNFYEMFCGAGGAVSKGGKPFMITETGVAVHLYVAPRNSSLQPVLPERTDPLSRVAMKQVWWSSFLNQTFLNLYPQFKGVSTFEFIKQEETTWRDFSVR